MTRKSAARFAFAGILISAIAGAGFGIRNMRDAPPGDAPLYLLLNVPAHRLYVYERGELTKTYRVSVGLPGHQTPAGSYHIRSLIWNPWWHPPNSAWAKGRKPEPPGEANPMGRVKLNFAPLLYLHGTNDPVVLGDPLSHGCVRLLNGDLIELTRLVHHYLTPKVTEATIDELAGTPSLTRTFNLPRSLPFDVIYQVATVKDGFLVIYPDVYRRVQDYEPKITAALKREGLDPARVDWSKLTPLIEHGRRTKVAISLDELLAPAVASQDVGGEVR